ncbi:uncharacterized protein Dwil_GK19649 [Drosophila willistoni]|uniref:MADF domain-containing protein n=1 Tax=Drosophila willistoni TaxID=7260 RepID=B4MNV9_DROWI|nr:uncharacterized protein LOC6639813 [Drosophila willistoni]EDW73798.1 uncharacterized protein Dwil_GK19649 [Drosophila willistoni]
MQRYYAERETTGPEFDDRLIKMVRANPAIYDVSHPHYRRNPVRVDIWDRIATELGASSRFLQTKWKNIRYNYLQEIKALETGQVNPNVRKRRFTEDLSFLQNTAQTYNVKKAQAYIAQNKGISGSGGGGGGSGGCVGIGGDGSDNDNDIDSHSYVYPDPDHLRIDSDNYDVIVLDNSEDGSQSDRERDADCDIDDDNELLPELQLLHEAADDELKPDVTIRATTNNNNHEHDVSINGNGSNSSSRYQQDRNSSPASSPLLTPMVVMGNGSSHMKLEEEQQQQQQQQHKHQHQDDIKPNALSNGEITIEPIYKPKVTRRAATMCSSEIMSSNASKRKAMPAPFSSITPISDPIELYCLSLVDTLRSMPRSERERVKFEFANILKDAKYRDES